ncbi:hypothetical protein GH714_041144 [Hevea brasiliensis]|uniref:Acyl-[acyl-carrier-protein] hydrolase n=1 Tax=Hevea brasiliensis TaxID=3981 RepID=A0A6A6N134_HEVBR|nr:hypothetical protein GH714_041144 [Hevea brasiliensis]
MAAFCYRITFPIRCTSNSSSKNDPNKLNLHKININGTSSARPHMIDSLSQTAGVATTSVASVAENITRQNIPTKKQYIDAHRQGLIVEGGVAYRQKIVIRSYEVGPDKTATLESILYLLQETALNHVWLSGLLSNGFGATHGMGEVVEIDTWVGASGKNGMRRDWLIRSQATGHVFARATSIWVMMNEKTRRLSKMPEEVRAEISPWFIEKQAIKEEVPEKIQKLDDKARYVITNLKPKRSDLDMNQHVNNVKYVRWMLETIPDQFLESHQLSGIILEYRRECGSSDIVQSLCEPDEDGIINSGLKQANEIPLLNGFSLASEIMEGNGLLGSLDKAPLRYTHLLLNKGDSQNEEIVRGKTMWKKKQRIKPFST